MDILILAAILKNGCIRANSSPVAKWLDHCNFYKAMKICGEPFQGTGNPMRKRSMRSELEIPVLFAFSREKTPFEGSFSYFYQFFSKTAHHTGKKYRDKINQKLNY